MNTNLPEGRHPPPVPEAAPPETVATNSNSIVRSSCAAAPARSVDPTVVTGSRLDVLMPEPDTTKPVVAPRYDRQSLLFGPTGRAILGLAHRLELSWRSGETIRCPTPDERAHHDEDDTVRTENGPGQSSRMWSSSWYARCVGRQSTSLL